MELLDWLNVIESVFVIGASAVVINGVNIWKKSLKERKRIEVAEATLSAFYEIKDVFDWVRNPGALGYEGETRKKGPNETEQQQKTLNGFYIPLERLNKDKEIFSKLQSLKYRFMTIFGKEQGKYFDEIKKVRTKIISSSQMLYNIYVDGKWDDERQQENITKWENIIGRGLIDDDKDKIRLKIEKIIGKVEKICVPILN